MVILKPEELQQMRDVDISTVDKSTLRDLKKVRVKKELPVPERVADFIEQIAIHTALWWEAQ